MNTMTMGARLKQERCAQRMTQSDVAEVGGVRKQAVIQYEHDRRVPKADFLAAVAAVGMDVHYIITGVRGAVSARIMPKGIKSLLEPSDGHTVARMNDLLEQAFVQKAAWRLLFEEAMHQREGRITDLGYRLLVWHLFEGDLIEGALL